MSIRWIRNVIIDAEKTTLEIQIGDKKIGDKCYTRIGNEVEVYFKSRSDVRDEIINHGKDILKKRLDHKSVNDPEGNPYDWQ